MPKDRRSSSLDRCRVSPYPWSNANAVRRKPRSHAMPVGNQNEWEEARCPICMEHPHNAVLLHCSSLEKGCRPYLCDTSPRHSNCLDQFKKSSVHKGSQATLFCPLCRGQVYKIVVNHAARGFMNSKTRSCSMDTCNYVGNYSQLRKHAKYEHPLVHPRDVDPERELKWQDLERDEEQQDLISVQFDLHEIDDENFEEEFIWDSQDMDGEDVELELELNLTVGDMLSMQFDLYEIDDEAIGELLDVDYDLSSPNTNNIH